MSAPIRVKAPDGTIIEFPATTDDATIERVMAEEYGGEKPGLLSRAGSAIADAWRGDAAAPEAKTAFDSPEFLQGRQAFRKNAGVLGSLGQALKELSASTLGNDEDLAKALAGTVPGSSVETDANGNPMIRLPSGEAVYANQPGMDISDPLKFAGILAAYLPAARVGRAIGGASTLGRAGVTGLASAATNAAGQAAAGREEVNLGEVAFTGAAGAAGEVVAPVVGKVIGTAKHLLRSGASKQQAAYRAAVDAGVEAPTTAQVQSLAKALDDIEAGADPAAVMQGDEFGFLFTTGQKMAPDDPRRMHQLAREEFLRSPQAAPDAPGLIRDPASILAGVDESNATALSRFVEPRTGGNTPAQSVGRAQQTLVEQREALKGRVKEAYGKVREGSPDFIATEGVQGIPNRLRTAIRDFSVDPAVNPRTAATLAELRTKMEGLKGMRASAVSLDSLEQQRRIIGNAIQGAQGSDKAALQIIKTEWDNAIDDAWETSLRSGDPAKLEALKGARELRAEFGRRFNPQGAGLELIDNFTAGRITPDEAVAKIMGVTQVAPPKAIPYLRAIKEAAAGSPEVMQQFRAAHFANLLQDSAGNILPPGKIAGNIARAERNTGSLIRELYTPDEWAQMRRLADATSRLSVRGPDANVTGGGRGLRGIQQIMQQQGALQTLARVPGVQWALNAVQQGVRASQASRAATGAMPANTGNAAVAAAAATQGENVNRQLTGGANPRL